MGSASGSRFGTCPFRGIVSLFLQILHKFTIAKTAKYCQTSPKLVVPQSARYSILAIFGNYPILAIANIALLQTPLAPQAATWDAWPHIWIVPACGWRRRSHP